MFVICGISLDDSSAIALMRARDLARTLRAGLLVAHIRDSRADDRNAVRERVCAWAQAATGLVVPAESVIVSYGEVASSLARASWRYETALVVVGMGSRTLDIIDRTSHPVLVAAAPTGGCVVVVGSDCSTERLPVVRSAASLAFRLGAPLIAVHSCQEPRPRFPWRLAPVVAAHRRFRLEQIRGVTEAIITDEEPSEAILRCATSRGAEMIAVGKSSRTTRIPRAILERARCSVLVVPSD